MSVHVTNHAVDRYIERVAPVSAAEAYAAMACAETAIERARAFGARTVRLANGAGLVLTGSKRIRVVTVLGAGQVNGGHFAQLQQPVCCGQCGLRCNHPVAAACTRAECPLGHHRRLANDRIAR